ncbi:universal stress protein [Streptomyces chromofuscus]|uniref:Universal stress protein n=1 Tax=Streptomyces chromofuscus TaxID=42881 RepID=A0A7M2T8S7_STRCW|nr:universal stress protein [Streptomyces chromofuscus]QOV45126.1 universal stress protein [Streptomyces chromofuscus]GGT40463.1 universal stress protein [Streptomyces chromofuscus]
MTGPVVVGVDGSSACMAAAWWAAREAVDRHAPLHLVHSWTSQPLDVPISQDAHSERLYGREVLRRTEAELLHRHGDLAVTTDLVAAPAAQALLARGGDAELLVLGSRGHGSVAGFLLGSTALRVVGLTRCPAVVVRADDPTVGAGRDRLVAADRDEVVVGVPEPGPAAEALLEFAFATADAHGDLLRAVTVVPGSPGPRAEEERRAWLAAELAPWREKYPKVTVAERVAVGPAAQLLLTSCGRSRLLIVGRRPHPSHLVWKLGPVAHAAVRHAACPVAVVPHG